MYFSDQPQAVSPLGSHPRPTSWPRLGLVGGNILFLGLTSLFTDISSEMVAAVLPIYLTVELRWSAWQFGLFDGLYQGMSIVLRLVGGVHRRPLPALQRGGSQWVCLVNRMQAGTPGGPGGLAANARPACCSTGWAKASAPPRAIP